MGVGGPDAAVPARAQVRGGAARCRRGNGRCKLGPLLTRAADGKPRPDSRLASPPHTHLHSSSSNAMKVPSLAIAALATASLASPALALGDALVDLALWGAGALSSTPKTGRLPGGPPEGGWSWTNCGQSLALHLAKTVAGPSIRSSDSLPKRAVGVVGSPRHAATGLSRGPPPFDRPLTLSYIRTQASRLTPSKSNQLASRPTRPCRART